MSEASSKGSSGHAGEPSAFVVRTMTKVDLPAVGQLAAVLVAQHYAFDPLRFMELPGAATGYPRYFASQLDAKETILLVAEDADGTLIGYAFGRLEERSYDALLDTHGALHDVFVADRGRRRGVGEALVREVVKQLADKGAPRCVLHTAVQNEAAQRLFARLGFRPTMIEMTRES